MNSVDRPSTRLNVIRSFGGFATRKGGFLANVLVLFSWAVVAQGITIAVVPLLTRLYHPEQFGVYSLFTNVAVLLAVVGALRYEFAIVLPTEDRDARSLVLLGLILAATAAAVTLMLGTAIGVLVRHSPKVGQLRPWLGWLAAAVFLSAVYSILMYWSLRQKAFASLAISRVVIAAAMAAVQLLTALWFGPYTALLIVAMVIGQASGVAFLVWRTKFRFNRDVTVVEIRAIAKRYISFPKYSAVGSLLDALSSLLPIAMLTILFSPRIAGLYAIADKVARTPAVLFGSSLQQVFYQRLAESRADPGACKALLVRTWRYLLAIGILPMAIIFATGPHLFGFVFGQQWIESGFFARILSVGLLVHFVAYPTTNGIVAFERLGVMLAWQALYVTSLIAVFGVGGFVLHLSPRAILWLFAGSQVLVQLVNLAAQWKVLEDHMGGPQAPSAQAALP